jgi:transcriptional regulator with XRE-family HTH domain
VRARCHLRTIREAKGLALADISERLPEIPKSALSEIERGQRFPRDEWIPLLADAYGASLAQMYDFEPPQFVTVETDPREGAA